MPKADLVLEGGGVKGLGTAGAVMGLLDAGYTFERVAGTSVGALAAAFVAAGVDADGFRSILDRLDLHAIPDRRIPLPLVSESVGLLAQRGAYAGDWIREWVRGELATVGVHTFADLRRSDPGADPALEQMDRRYRLVVMATDVTNGRLLRLPWDYHLFNLEPDEQPVADAVRMSLSIPFYFEPCELRNALTGDTRRSSTAGCCPTSRSRSSTAPTGRNHAGRRSASGCSPTCRPASVTSCPSTACRCCRPSGCSSGWWRRRWSAGTRRTWNDPACGKGR